MIQKTKTVLYVNLEKKKYEVKQHEDLVPFVGGIGVSYKLFSDSKKESPVVLSIGPLTGLFPYISKTCALFEDNGKVLESYIGGSLGVRLKFTGLDSVVFTGRSKELVNVNIENHSVEFVNSDLNKVGIPGRRCIIDFERGSAISNYFTFGEKDPAVRFNEMNLRGIAVSGSGSFVAKDWGRYEQLYSEIMQRSTDLTVSKSNLPSCSSCPVGCKLSFGGEVGTEGSVLTHSLVGCGYASNIYEEIPTVFSCLSSLGYSYTHEDLENLSVLVSNIKTDVISR